MQKQRATIMVSVEIDPIPGGMDNLNIERDVFRILESSIPHYHPVVLRMDNLHKYDTVVVVKGQD